MRQMDSGALTELSKILQLGGGGEQTTELDDGNVSQVLDIEHVIRRSLTPAASRGLFWFGFSNTHAGAGVISSTLNPFAVDVGANGFPTIIPPGFDFWHIYSHLRQVSGAIALSGATIEIIQQGVERGKGFAASSVSPLGIWTDIELLTGENYGITAQGETIIRFPTRLRPGSIFRFLTNATGVAIYRGVTVVGLFPAGMGQDVVS